VRWLIGSTIMLTGVFLCFAGTTDRSSATVDVGIVLFVVGLVSLMGAK